MFSSLYSSVWQNWETSVILKIYFIVCVHLLKSAETIVTDLVHEDGHSEMSKVRAKGGADGGNWVDLGDNL
jgi:uncharacterized membrane protein